MGDSGQQLSDELVKSSLLEAVHTAVTGYQKNLTLIELAA